ncbi:GCN5-related N-acetyltransferase [Pelosinus fermentans DSM 17108]|jgi:GNAT superfamily N-acetyltransferase|uniref:GCN5-related N-acetyltransferase n=2 Tax=Pelosinus TaxID=365348 RepID=I8RM79_9FIRM|nr:GNAT family N-acetyltransferase [Pelosinus sp. HCF1]EIW19880.1 GCN5-related N-acetyltransferase [Pelosinus fermentans B4]EIW21263.1 GCN5-related N-acetyltransferase [Pelosinus fermentans A11]OAM95035.1 GCN5-related N-acetyltransferase [Pelosinus fermentans DSM 17108]
MWPEKDIEYIKLKDDELGKHFGLFVNHDLISVISLFEKNNVVQFRKFATLQELQGKGYGSVLLDYVLKEAEKQGATSFWCNARVNKIDFYKKFGFEEIEEAATKDGMKYVKMSKNF